ncbi:MAG: M28 family peptidase [Leptolyngbyaceae cyanobacterium MO_188.B28]|nr:M28 family peptidase [Leptolyngbyaceae cyanobacterium MO_188.B28]
MLTRSSVSLDSKETRSIRLILAKGFVASASVISLISFGLAGCARQSQQETPPQAIKQDVTQASKSLHSSPHPSRDEGAGGAARMLVSLGARVTGTPATESARAFLLEEYRQAGYVTTLQSFTYNKYEDEGSSLTVGERLIEGRVISGSATGNVRAPLAAVPGVGKPEDFAAVDVRGAIAIVRRGEITFLAKAEHAAEAGAVGLVVVNYDPDIFSGTLGRNVEIPVLALSGEAGGPLLEPVQTTSLEADIAINVSTNSVTGQNIIAHLDGVTQPRIIIGGHYDSVADSPGANDNASGTAVVLELARQFSNTPFADQIWFVAFDGEEDGLHGSRAFVREADPQFLSGLSAMLNFDMVGVNDDIKVGGASSLTAIAQTTDSSIDDFGSAGGSDHVPFEKANVPILFFTRGLEPNYHTPNDTQVNPELLEEMVQVGREVVGEVIGGME